MKLLSEPKPKWYEWLALCSICLIVMYPFAFAYLSQKLLIIEALGEFGFGLGWLAMMTSIMCIMIKIFNVPNKKDMERENG